MCANSYIRPASSDVGTNVAGIGEWHRHRRHPRSRSSSCMRSSASHNVYFPTLGKARASQEAEQHCSKNHLFHTLSSTISRRRPAASQARITNRCYYDQKNLPHH
jgi:hypothetical protein